MQPPGLRERHRQDVSGATIVGILVKRADQEPTDEHARDRVTHGYRTVR